jgi:hypothetical protein
MDGQSRGRVAGGTSRAEGAALEHGGELDGVIAGQLRRAEESGVVVVLIDIELISKPGVRL